MTHEERVGLAREIAGQILNEHGEAIVAIAIYGSVAKNEDAEHSDLEMWAVKASGSNPSPQRLFIQEGTFVDLSFIFEERILRMAGEVDEEWPITAASWRSYMPLYDRNDFFKRLAQSASDLNEEDFSNAMRTAMLWTYETIGKLKNAAARNDMYGVMNMGRHLVWNAAMMLGLANRRWYPSQRGLYQMSKTMEKQPKDYPRLLDVAGGFITADTGQVYEASLELWNNLQEFARGLGVEWEDGQAV